MFFLTPNAQLLFNRSMPSLHLFSESMEVVAAGIAAELRADRMTREELVELCQLSWQQLQLDVYIPKQDTTDKEAKENEKTEETGDTEESDEMVSRFVSGHFVGIPVIESLCGSAPPTREGWTEWLATALACMALLWETDPAGHAMPFRFGGHDWTGWGWKWGLDQSIESGMTN